MAINKNFVVKNGLEVAADVIVADATTKNVGVGTTVGRLTLDVRGSIGSTDLSVIGIGTIVTLNSTNGTITNLTGTSSTVTTINSTNGIITNLTGTAGTITNGTIVNLTGTAGTITTLGSTNGTITNLTGTAGTITNGTITNLTGTAGTITNGTITNLSSINLNNSGFSTFAGITTVTGSTLFTTQLSVSGISTFRDYAQFIDNASVYFGNGADLRIYHSGSHSFIQEQGDGNLYIQSNGGSINIRTSSTATENAFVANEDGSVELYYDNSKKFETTGYGITVYGTLEAQQLNVTGVGTLTTFNTTNLTGVAATIGSITISSGIITATSGVVTYYGDGQYLSNLSSDLQSVLNKGNSATLGVSLSGVSTFGEIKIGSGIITSTSGVVTYYGDGQYLQNLPSDLQSVLDNGNSATLGVSLSGVSTFGEIKIGSGIITATSGVVTYYGDGQYLTGLPGNPSLSSVLNAGNTSVTGMSISGVSTLTTLNSTNTTITNLTGTAGTITNGTITNLTGTAGTITALNSTNGTITNLTGTSGTFTTLIVNTNFDVYDTQATFHNNLYVAGNLSIGGTTSIISAQDLVVLNKDIILGYTTSITGSDASTDTTANHGGVSIASTQGTPLVPFKVTGINTQPDTYKQIMWVKSGTYSGLGTDAWMFNYGVGIGSTQFPLGTRLASGAVQFTERDLVVIQNINASGIITSTSLNTTNLVSTNINSSGIITAARLGINTTSVTQQFQVGSGTTIVVIDSLGDVGIATTNPTSKLHIIGDVLVSGIVTCTDINSTSDVKLKTNIQTVENALDVVNNLRGVSFDWKENGKSSYGVIAQELEQVLPDLVSDTDPKTVNYNGIIGVLIEAIKELKKEILDLKNNK